MPARTELSSGTKSEDTRDRILETALTLFREKGFEAATMRDIAAGAGVATGAAYYYFSSKDAIVLAFYHHAITEMSPQLEQTLASSTDLRKRLAGLLEVKLSYFSASRRLLAALAVHMDPAHPLSPFSEDTRDIREQDIAFFAQAIAGSKLRVARDLENILPKLLWMYQMGLILFWIHDRSPEQKRTTVLIDRSLQVVMLLIRLSGLPLMRPLRRKVLDLCNAAFE